MRFGVKFHARNGRISYDFTPDSGWAELKAEETAVANARKKRERVLKILGVVDFDIIHAKIDCHERWD